jgi:YqaJ-like viral recombinase domain
LETERVIKVDPCGLFVDPEYPYLGASPDGLVGDDYIVEVKCPASAQAYTPEEAVAQKKINYLIYINGSLQLKLDHNYMYQIQGQLHITRRKYCYFVVWTPKGMFMQIIERDDVFWSSKMIDKLSRFYLNCLLPEIVDSRRDRKRPTRDPDYIV